MSDQKHVDLNGVGQIEDEVLYQSREFYQDGAESAEMLAVVLRDCLRRVRVAVRRGRSHEARQRKPDAR